MNDKELADRIMALGVGYDGYKFYMCESKYFVRDWRVAGALMEKTDGVDYDHDEYGEKSVGRIRAYKGGLVSEAYVYDSLPRAICEACVEALETDQ